MFGGFWKQLTTSITNQVSTNFPFQPSSSPSFQIGPFQVCEAINTSMPTNSAYSKACLWRAKASDPTAQLLLKQMRTLQHPSMLRAVAVREQNDEILVATEWCSVVGSGDVVGSDEEQREWMEWQLEEVQKWLEASGVEASERTLLFTQSGELRLILIGDGLSSNNSAYGHAAYGHGHTSLPSKSTTTPSKSTTKSTTNANTTNPLIRLSQDLQFLPTMNPSQQAAFYSNLPLQRLPAPIIKHLLLPKCVSFRSTLLSLGHHQPVSSEEVRVLFGAESRSVCGGEGDFAGLLGGVAEGLLSGRAAGAGAAGEAVLTEFLGRLGEWCGDGLIGGEWMTTCLVPHLMRIFSGALSERSAVAVSQSAVFPKSSILHSSGSIPHSSGSAAAQLRFAVLAVLKGSIPRLPPKTLSSDVLRLLARGQVDADPGIRRETMLLLDSALPRCSPEIRSKVAGPALCRALSDADAGVRGEGMRMLLRWVQWIGVEECAGRVGVVLLGRAGDLRDAREAGEAIDAIERVIVPRLRAALSSKGGVSKGGGVSEGSNSTTSTTSTANATSTPTTNNTPSTPFTTTAYIPSTNNLNATPSNSKLRLGSIKKIT